MTDSRPNLSALAAEIGPGLAEHASRHDREGSFVEGSYEELKKRRVLSALVPAELGGMGASLEGLCHFLRELAHHCPSTSLALSMHQHLVAAAVWKWSKKGEGEPLLRRVADEQLVLVSTGATDWIDSVGETERVEGGYRVTARKVFGSGSPVADLLVTSAPYDDPEEGPVVLHFPVPFSAEGVTVTDDWDTMGMRGTGSHTVLFDRVFVPDDKIALRRPSGQWHPAWTVALAVAAPIYMSVYVGVAEAAQTLATTAARGKSGDPHLPYLLGELECEVAATRTAWEAMIRNAAEYEFAPVVQTANRAVVLKTVCSRSAIAAVEKAVEASGGRGFYRKFGLEQLLRDVHAAPYHPLPEKRQAHFSGRLAMGLDPITGAPL